MQPHETPHLCPVCAPACAVDDARRDRVRPRHHLARLRRLGVQCLEAAHQNIGADLVAKAPPDGYTLLMATVSTHAINPGLYKNMPYDSVKSFAPVALVGEVANVLAVNPSFPA